MKRILLVIICFLSASCSELIVEPTCKKDEKYSIDWFTVIVNEGGFPPLEALNRKEELISSELESKLKEHKEPDFSNRLTPDEQKRYAFETFDLANRLVGVREEKEELLVKLIRLYSHHFERLRIEFGNEIALISAAEKKQAATSSI